MSEQIHNHRVFTLNEVLKSVQKTLANRYQSAYWMKAEMNKLNFYNYSGHCYPDLVEKSEGKVVAQARALIWSRDFQVINKKFLQILKEPLKDGINILFLAKIDFKPAHGLSLQILDIDPSFSLGILEQEKQENIAKLQQEGLFRKNKSLPFPLLPQNIAVISVETSKGYADFLKILNQNPAGYRIYHHLFPARLQGEQAVQDIVRQLKKIRKHAELFDVVTIIRGGGGEVGLSAFNHYALAREIAGFPLPVLTGIGHATNETIAEMVAYQNAITPTECAQFLLTRFENFDYSIQKMQQKLAHATHLQLNQQKEQQAFFLQVFERATVRIFNTQREIIRQRKMALDKSVQLQIKAHNSACHSLQNDLTRQSRRFLAEQKKAGEQLEKSIRLMDPENILKRGFSITKINGKTISPEAALPKEGKEIETILYQGQLKSTITYQQKENCNGTK